MDDDLNQTTTTSDDTVSNDAPTDASTQAIDDTANDSIQNDIADNGQANTDIQAVDDTAIVNATDDDAQTASDQPADDPTAILGNGDSPTLTAARNQIADELMNQDLIKILKLDHLPEEEKEQLKEKMINTIQGRVMARVMDSLSTEDQKKLGELLDGEDKVTTEDFLKEKVALRDIVLQETLLYKAEMIDNAQQIDKMVVQSPANTVKETEEEPSTAMV